MKKAFFWEWTKTWGRLIMGAASLAAAANLTGCGVLQGQARNEIATEPPKVAEKAKLEAPLRPAPLSVHDLGLREEDLTGAAANPGDALAELHAVEGGQTVLRRTVAFNPTDRPLKLWVRAQGTLGLSIYLRFQDIVQSPDGPGIRFAEPDHRVSRTQMALAAVQAHHSKSGKTDAPEVSADRQWAGFTIGAREELQINWSAQKTGESGGACAFPPNVVRHLLVGIQGIQPQFSDFTASWSMEGSSLTGDLKLSTTVTEVDEQPKDEVTNVSATRLEQARGVRPDQAAAGICQGFY